MTEPTAVAPAEQTVATTVPTGKALTQLVERLGKERTKIEARLAEIEAQLPALKAKADDEYAEAQRVAAIESVGLELGTTVEADYGRGEKRRVVVGTVKAFAAKTDKLPALYAIEIGVGVDAEIIKVPAVSVRPVSA
jgi:hypothetical protein